ncbi:MAG: hypothetical protein R3B08_05220 [Nitrospira sp.]
MDHIDIPEHWTQFGRSMFLAQKYFRKAGVPQIARGRRAGGGCRRQTCARR